MIAIILPPAGGKLPGFPNAVKSRPKTRLHGSIRRRRWLNDDGRIIEWDYQHGTVELYDRRGRHLGEFDPLTGQQIKPSNPLRSVEP